MDIKTFNKKNKNKLKIIQNKTKKGELFYGLYDLQNGMLLEYIPLKQAKSEKYVIEFLSGVLI